MSDEFTVGAHVGGEWLEYGMKEKARETCGGRKLEEDKYKNEKDRI